MALKDLSNKARESVTIKLIAVAVLVLLLLIPAAMVRGVIYERSYTRDSAVEEVSSKWGGVQTVAGPVLVVPYMKRVVDSSNKVITVRDYAHFLPDDLKIDAKMTPEIRQRGIFDVILYTSDIEIAGTLSAPDFSGIDNVETVLLNEAFLVLGVTDMRGFQETVQLDFAGSKYAFEPGIETSDLFNSGLSTSVPLSGKSKYPFSLKINLNGSETLYFLPLGKETVVNVSSDWNAPSFDGAFLPDERTVGENGFSATWNVLYLNRNYPQIMTTGDIKNIEPSDDYLYLDRTYRTKEVLPTDSFYGSSFGVKLLLPVDTYHKTERSIKYDVLFTGLTFLLFFFVEVINRKRIHPIQYLLVGIALTVFYLLLLSLSEHIGFGRAYLVAAFAIVSLVGAYGSSVLRDRKIVMILTGVLAFLYGFLYVLLQLEDYALLMGSIGLFTMIAVVMYVSRNIDWYEIGHRK